MNPKMFLKWGGVILLVLGVLGFVWPAPQLYPTFYLDGAENWAHLVLGLVALAIAYWADGQTQKWIATLVGVVALYFGVWGFVVGGAPEPNYYGITNLEMLDNIVHLVVGVWALWSVYGNNRS
jgi:uncharacterized membrane protein HdeD (DUF308 family)